MFQGIGATVRSEALHTAYRPVANPANCLSAQFHDRHASTNSRLFWPASWVAILRSLTRSQQKSQMDTQEHEE